jgi:uncharacterized protein YbbC (DUF1343 family)
MVITGLESILKEFPAELKGKRIGILCHAPSITQDFKHISDIFFEREDCRLAGLFGPQHGIHGQTQDNMIEWQSQKHPVFYIPIYSLYGKNRKPTPEMLNGIDVFLIDIQDVGARLYTYIWTVKLCMEACTESGIPVWLLDRPNPIGRLPFDGPVLKKEYFTFVGGASIPLCHRMTIGEMALWIKEKYYPGCDLNVVWMKNWRRSSLFSDTGLPWVSIYLREEVQRYHLSFLAPRLLMRKNLKRILITGMLKDVYSELMILFQHSINSAENFAMVCRYILLISTVLSLLGLRWKSLMQ